LHHFNYHRHHCWIFCHVPHPTSPIPWGDQKPISVARWWHPYCHAHSFVYHMAIGSHQFSQHVLHFILLGFVTWLPTYLCHSIKLMHVYGKRHLDLVDSRVGVVQVIMKLFDWMQGAIIKCMITIEEMVGMDVLCNDKTWTFTLNKLTIDNNLVEVCKSKEWNIAPCVWSAKVFSCKFTFQVKHKYWSKFFSSPTSLKVNILWIL